jgi:peroxiredoxin
MFWVLWMAALSNFAFGGLLSVFTNHAFRLLGVESPVVSVVWEVVGVAVAIYGVAYAVAAFDPARHWRLVLIGLISNLGGLGVFLYAAIFRGFPWEFGWLVLLVDGIWLVPFGAVLYHTYERYRMERSAAYGSIREALGVYRNGDGEDLLTLSAQGPLLIVFLRHAGCTFCREAMGDLAAVKRRIDERGSDLVVVQMGSDREGAELAQRFGLRPGQVVSDPSRRLYRTFELRRGSLWELFGPKVIFRGVAAAVLKGYGIGKVRGDSTQMPGVFLVRDGEVVREYRHRSVADRPDYVALASLSAESPAGGPGSGDTADPSMVSFHTNS